MIGRIPDVGVGPERQGPRTLLTVNRIRELRAAHDAGTRPVDLARMYNVGIRSVYRYLAGRGDPVGDLFVTVLSEANEEFGLGLNRSQVEDTAREILRRLRQRGWSELAS